MMANKWQMVNLFCFKFETVNIHIKLKPYSTLPWPLKEGQSSGS